MYMDFLKMLSAYYDFIKYLLGCVQEELEYNLATVLWASGRLQESLILFYWLSKSFIKIDDLEQ